MVEPTLSRTPSEPSEGVAITASDAAQYLGDNLPMDGVYEKRIHCLIFAATVNWNVNHDIPFSNTTFKKMGPQIFGPEIRPQVQEWRSRPAFPPEVATRTRKYSIKLVECNVDDMEGEQTEDALAYLDAVIDEFGGMDRRDLMKWCTSRPELEGVIAGEEIDV